MEAAPQKHQQLNHFQIVCLHKHPLHFSSHYPDKESPAQAFLLPKHFTAPSLTGEEATRTENRNSTSQSSRMPLASVQPIPNSLSKNTTPGPGLEEEEETTQNACLNDECADLPHSNPSNHKYGCPRRSLPKDGCHRGRRCPRHV